MGEKIDIKEMLIHVTSQCNKNCSHCYVPKQLRTKENCKSLTLEDLEWIKNSFNIKKTILLGGEPLLYEHLEESLDMFPYTTISTNGKLVPDKIKDIKNHVKGVQISVEGDQEITDRIRGKDTWKQVWKAVESCKKHNVDSYLRSSVWDGNLKKIMNLGEKAREKKIPLVLFPRVDKKPLPTRLQISLFDHILENPYMLIAQPHFFQYINKKKGRCGAGDERMNIFYDKNLTPCNFDSDYILGQVGDRVSNIEHRVKVFLDVVKTVPLECTACTHSDVCKGSCYVSNWHQGCPLRHSFDFRNYLKHTGNDYEEFSDHADNLAGLVKKMVVC